MATQSASEDTNTFTLLHPSGAEATIALQGGHIISWKTADGVERLFLSELAEFGPGKAIRGGVPVIFPQFSDHGPFGRHGFARKSRWTRSGDSNRVQLSSTPESLKEWPHQFELELEVTLSETELLMELSVKNSDESDFQFHAALHTYLKTPQTTAASVMGLEGESFLNEVTKQVETDPSPAITFSGEVDRAYFGAGDKVITLADSQPRIDSHSDNFPDIVVWNPGPDHTIGDLSKKGWNHFVCIEGARMHEYEMLAPGQSWKASQRLRAIY